MVIRTRRSLLYSSILQPTRTLNFLKRTLLTVAAYCSELFSYNSASSRVLIPTNFSACSWKAVAQQLPVASAKSIPIIILHSKFGDERSHLLQKYTPSEPSVTFFMQPLLPQDL